MYKLIIFDWDGTLCDSASRIVHCMQLAMTDVGLPVLADEAIRNIIGLGLPEASRVLYPDGDSEQLEQLRQRYSHHYVANQAIDSPLFPGASNLLADLKTAGKLLAVATGKSRKGLNRVLEQFNLDGVFHSTRCADETRSKPDPLMLEELMAELQLNPSECVMVGDTEFDLAMAQQAGMDRIAVSFGAHNVARLQQYQPRLVVDDLTELGDWLLGRSGSAASDLDLCSGNPI